MYSWAVGSPSPRPDSRSHLGLNSIQYITGGRTKKQPENLNWWRPTLIVERQEYH